MKYTDLYRKDWFWDIKEFVFMTGAFLGLAILVVLILSPFLALAFLLIKLAIRL